MDIYPNKENKHINFSTLNFKIMENFDQYNLQALDVNELQEIEGGFFIVFVAGFAAGVAAGVAVAALLN